MGFTRLKKYLENLSIKRDLPKLIFVALYIIFIFINVCIISVIEYYHKKDYQTFFNAKMDSMESTDSKTTPSSYESYFDWFQKEIPDDSYVQNIAFIIWDKDGKVLWHSNKLIEKFVGADASRSNELFKNMSFLDIPEKNFKPYETFEKYKTLLANQQANQVASSQFSTTDFKKQMVIHFFKIPDIKQEIYVEALRNFNRIVSIKIFIIMLISSLLLALVFSYAAFLLIKIFLVPIDLLNLSIDHFLKYRRAEIASYYSNSEPGHMVKKYNSLVQMLSTMQNDFFDDKEGSNQKTIVYLQQRLLRKAIHKSDNIELLLFPKNPDSEFRKFVTLEENGEVTSLLFVHFDINNIESNIEKHILQDRFKELNEKSLTTDEINEELYRDFISHSEIGPGFLFLRIENAQLDWVRSGPFHLFLINFQDRSCELLTGGQEYISSEKNMIESTVIDKNSILIISDELLDFLNMDSSEFGGLISDILDRGTQSGKNFLGQIMQSIDDLNSDALKNSSLISLIRIK